MGGDGTSEGSLELQSATKSSKTEDVSRIPVYRGNASGALVGMFAADSGPGKQIQNDSAKISSSEMIRFMTIRARKCRSVGLDSAIRRVRSRKRALRGPKSELSKSHRTFLR